MAAERFPEPLYLDKISRQQRELPILQSLECHHHFSNNGFSEAVHFTLCGGGLWSGCGL